MAQAPHARAEPGGKTFGVASLELVEVPLSFSDHLHHLFRRVGSGQSPLSRAEGPTQLDVGEGAESFLPFLPQPLLPRLGVPQRPAARPPGSRTPVPSRRAGWSMGLPARSANDRTHVVSLDLRRR